ncbi:circadian locomoter output cycles protein kaput-like [Homarus americanus]|uniref:circadian locomoter output cycles protein kaput-like n=1 Tax=Homarus americanus TaxID=6706 RepID=UPI001C448136|nr:circadian locomoter output cycles protein kaput-like [Homarus americanus]
MRNMAEKMRRDKLNHYVNELATIVPLGSGANKRIDKTSVLRLAANFIRMHKVLKEDDDDSGRAPPMLSSSVTHSLAEAVGGFLLVVTSTGKVVYIAEAVDQFFGHSQVDLLGQSIYNVIHPDDHEIFQQQLNPRENNRRSFFCRMMEKALTRNDPGRYEIIHIVGHLRPIPQSAGLMSSSSCVLAPSPSGTNTSSDHDDDNESDVDGDNQSLKSSTSRSGTHILVSFVRVVKDRPITELSLVESTQEEYITRHGMDAKILYTDHRISFVTGLMPAEVVGTSAFTYMHPDDMMWSIVAQKLMFTSSQGQGIVSYRLRCRDGSHVTLRSRGYLEVNKQTGQVESFVCINTVLSVKEAENEIKNQRRKLLPIITSQESDDHLSSISSSLPPELLMVLKQMMNPETVQKMIESVNSLGNVENENSDVRLTQSDEPSPQTPIQKDTVNSPNHHEEGCNEVNPFQSRPKRFCSFDAFSSPPEGFDDQSPGLKGHRVKTVDEDPWYNPSNKRTLVDDMSSVSTKKFNLEREPIQFHTCPTQQYSSLSSTQLCSSTSPLHTDNGLYSSSPGQQYGSGNLIHPESPQQCGTANYQQSKNNQLSPAVTYEPPGTQTYQKSWDIQFSENCNQNNNGCLPLQKSYNHNIRGGVISPGTLSQNVSPGIPSPGNNGQSVSGGRNPSSHFEQGRSAAIFSSNNHEQVRSGSIPSLDSKIQNSDGRGISSLGNYSLTSSTLLPTGNYEQNRINHNKNLGSHQQSESDITNPPSSHQKYRSSMILPPCNYQPLGNDSITHSKDHSPTFPQSQFLPQYSQNLRVQTSQEPHQQYHHQQQQPVPEHFQTSTNLRHDLKFSSTPEFDIKMQRQQVLQQKSHNLHAVHDVGEPTINHIVSQVNPSQCLPYGTTVVSGGKEVGYKYAVTSGSPESGLSVQCSANFQLNTALPASGISTLPESSASQCQQACESQLHGHLITNDISEQVFSSRQVQHCQPHSKEGGKLV